MKKIIFGLVTVFFFNCSDGDLQIETIDFDDVAVQNCDDISAVSSNFLFKISSDEALILELQSGVLNNGNSITDTVETSSLIPNQSSLTYRLFSGNVNNSYFCDDLPAITPTVTDEVTAEAGMVIIKSIANTDSTAFTHLIQLDDITLINSAGERLTDLRINDFGEVSTAISN